MKPAISSLHFAAFVLWLVVFPMSGSLLPPAKAPSLMLYFLAGHIVAILLLAGLRDERAQLILFRASGGLTSLLTASFPHFPEHPELIMGTLGVAAAPLAVGVIVNLKRSPAPPWAAAVGLLTGNLLAALFSQVAATPSWLFLLIALPPVLLMPFPIDNQAPTRPDSVSPPFFAGLTPYLPFIFLFYLIGGLMFGFISPQYAKVSPLAGIELLAYGIATLGGAWLVGRNRDLLLVLGLLCAMLSLTLLEWEPVIATIISMYANHLAFGLIDLFLICLLLNQAQNQRAVAIGLAVMLLAIFSGTLVAGNFAAMGQLLTSAGTLILTMAILALYFLGWWRPQTRANQPIPQNPENAAATTDASLRSAPVAAVNPEQLVENWNAGRATHQKQLSEQEKLVVALVLAGHTYKEAARELGISQSSIKTYMKRVFDKAGVNNKHDLLREINKGEDAA
ncbi:LuxR C-terminal-related transcriptional regulator [Desulfurivibrio sp. D14AmB]|uniref:helix-turn-helix transcriptional regulator n=1 Tax=Desulfurivibrio sp. D14AmB TaxID=3374370 RepID=UPI00376EBFF5